MQMITHLKNITLFTTLFTNTLFSYGKRFYIRKFMPFVPILDFQFRNYNCLQVQKGGTRIKKKYW